MVFNEDINLRETDSIVNDYAGLVAFHENPQATIYTVIGTAGQGFQIRPADPTPEWNELVMEEFAYAVLTAVNGTCLVWELINNVDNTVLDKMVITQPSRFPISFGMSQETFEHEWINGDPMSYRFSIAIFMCIIVLFVVNRFELLRRCNGKKRSPSHYTVINDNETISLPIHVVNSYQSAETM